MSELRVMGQSQAEASWLLGSARGSGVGPLSVTSPWRLPRGAGAVSAWGVDKGSQGPVWELQGVRPSSLLCV